MDSRDVYTLKEFMEIISIQEQTFFQKSRYEKARRDEHPLVTEMFGELYFRESPTSTLEALFSAPVIVSRGVTPEPPATEETPSEETKAASDGEPVDHGNGDGNGKDLTPEQASPTPN